MTTLPSDEELIKRIDAGDVAAFELLYDRRQAGIYRFALRMSGSAAIAEDVTQEVFMLLISRQAQFDCNRGATVATFLYGIARHRVLQKLARERSFVPIDDELTGEAAEQSEWITPSQQLSDLTRNETIEQVRQAVLALHPEYREVVVLCDLNEMSYQEAAEVIGCAIGTIRSRLHRARLQLIKKLRALNHRVDGVTNLNSAECLS